MVQTILLLLEEGNPLMKSIDILYVVRVTEGRKGMLETSQKALS